MRDIYDEQMRRAFAIAKGEAQAEAAELQRRAAMFDELVEVLYEFACQYACGCKHPACKNCERDRAATVILTKAKEQQS